MGLSTTSTLAQTVPSASLAFFRICFGMMMFFSALRFLAKGWVDELYIKPEYFFPYYGFSWVKVLPGEWMYVPFVALAIFSLMIALGMFYRVVTPLYFLIFTYTELLDKSNYLNHYYFISLLSFLMIFLPLHRHWSLDVYFKITTKVQMPTWVLKVLRLQVGLVYFFAGVAKLKSDWFLEAMPLKFWLPANSDYPLLGPLFLLPWVPIVASWFGAIFDLTIPLWLSLKKTRVVGYAMVVFFHVFTGTLFQIGMFPWIMMVSALVFFEPDWPVKFWNTLRRVIKRAPLKSASSDPQAGSVVVDSPSKKQRNFFYVRALFSSISRPLQWVLALFFLVQILLPLRHHLYPGHVLWTEEGYRFSWNVMLMEKNGTLEFVVVDPDTSQRWVVPPSDYLKPYQVKQASTQPDMILQLAHHVADDFRSKGHPRVEVYVKAMTSLNGRLPQALIDPYVNLAQETLSLKPKKWIQPSPAP